MELSDNPDNSLVLDLSIFIQIIYGFYHSFELFFSNMF